MSEMKCISFKNNEIKHYGVHSGGVIICELFAVVDEDDMTYVCLDRENNCWNIADVYEIQDILVLRSEHFVSN
jgi:hypothetical protein